MIRATAFAIVLSLAYNATSEEIRVGHFDLDRVFREYQRTQHLNEAISDKRHAGGPGSHTPAIEQREVLLDHIANLQKAVDAAELNSPDRERAELRLQIARLNVRIDELQRAQENARREQAAAAEIDRQRSKILGEITSVATRICKEQNYHFAFPYNAPQNSMPLVVIVPSPGDDLTAAILAKLNQEYNAARAK